MTSILKVAGACAGLLLLAGCAGQELYDAQQIEPAGSAFDQALYQGYVGLSESEYAEADYMDSDVFAKRAITAGRAGAVAPEDVAARKIPAEHVAEMTEARTMLVRALEAGAAEKDPSRAAEAQVMFDCWMQEQEENWQPQDIARCRDGFYAAVEPLAPAAPVAMEKAKPQTIRFVVYFATDKHELDDAAQSVVAEAIAAAKKLDSPVVRISGNADTVGPDAYNMMLSEMRAQAVAKVIGATPVRSLNTEAMGESNPAVKTGDDVAEPRNRRVEIVLEP